MDRNSVDWTGPMPALTTPFNADGTLDIASHEANIERQLDAGATGFVAVGCTGEFWALDNAERLAVADATVKVLNGRGTAIIGAGSVMAQDVIAQSRSAATIGADAILVMPPYFLHATEDEVFAHYETIDRATELPIVLYNIPGNAGNALTPGLTSRLADLPNVVAIKESSGDWINFHRTLLAVGDRIRVFCGPSSVFGVEAVRAGADGLIDCFPNVWTKGCLDLWYEAIAGNFDEAHRLQAQGLALTELFVSGGRTLYPSTKAAMDYLGFAGGGIPRPPLQALKGAALTELCAGLDQILGLDSHINKLAQAGGQKGQI